MSGLVNDVKTTLKGVKGAGDAIRGEVLDATDRAFEKDPNHPTTIEKNAENEAIREKGKQDVRNLDEMVAGHEWNKKDRRDQRTAAAHGTEHIPTTRNDPNEGRDRPAHLEPRGMVAPTEPVKANARAAEQERTGGLV